MANPETRIAGVRHEVTPTPKGLAGRGIGTTTAPLGMPSRFMVLVVLILHRVSSLLLKTGPLNMVRNIGPM